jgi:hypothetical protein
MLDTDKELSYPTIEEVNKIMEIAAGIRYKQYTSYSWEVLNKAIEIYYKEKENESN